MLQRQSETSASDDNSEMSASDAFSLLAVKLVAKLARVHAELSAAAFVVFSLRSTIFSQCSSRRYLFSTSPRSSGKFHYQRLNLNAGHEARIDTIDLWSAVSPSLLPTASKKPFSERLQNFVKTSLCEDRSRELRSKLASSSIARIT